MQLHIRGCLPPTTKRSSGSSERIRTPRQRRSLILGATSRRNTASMSSSRPFPGFNRLYVLESTGSDREFIADIEYGGADALAITRAEQTTGGMGVTARWAMGSGKPSP